MLVFFRRRKYYFNMISRLSLFHCLTDSSLIDKFEICQIKHFSIELNSFFSQTIGWNNKKTEKFNQAANTSNQIVERKKINSDLACSQGEGRHIYTNCNRSLCKRLLFFTCSTVEQMIKRIELVGGSTLRFFLSLAHADFWSKNVLLVVIVNFHQIDCRMLFFFFFV